MFFDREQRVAATLLQPMFLRGQRMTVSLEPGSFMCMRSALGCVVLEGQVRGRGDGSCRLRRIRELVVAVCAVGARRAPEMVDCGCWRSTTLGDSKLGSPRRDISRPVLLPHETLHQQGYTPMVRGSLGQFLVALPSVT